MLNQDLIKNKFRNASGVRHIRGLFWELALNKYSCLYTLRREPREVKFPNGEIKILPSIMTAYLDCMDPTEYEFANKYFEDYEHWELISNSPFLAEYVAKWRKELKVKIRSEAYKQIAQEAFLGGRNSFQANKYLVDGEFSQTPKKSKATLKEEEALADAVNSDKQIFDDLIRLGVMNKE